MPAKQSQLPNYMSTPRRRARSTRRWEPSRSPLSRRRWNRGAIVMTRRSRPRSIRTTRTYRAIRGAEGRPAIQSVFVRNVVTKQSHHSDESRYPDKKFFLGFISTLDWIGKKVVLNHHNEAPFRLLRVSEELSVGAPDSGNLLVQGDNLEALKFLLPYYAEQVKYTYIDPPYNTGVRAVGTAGLRTRLSSFPCRQESRSPKTLKQNSAK